MFALRLATAHDIGKHIVKPQIRQKTLSLFSKYSHYPKHQLTFPVLHDVNTYNVSKRLRYSTVQPPYWDYSQEHGPSTWDKTWKVGKNQSPIDILTSLAQHDSTLGQLHIDTTSVTLNFLNKGVNISVTPRSDKSIILTGGALQHQYTFMEFHFHWGDVNTCGCEHSLNGHRFAAELHIVHWNSQLYKTKEDALSNDGGLAVLGVFLDAQNSHNSNEQLDVLFNMAANVVHKNDSHDTSDAFSPYLLLPEKTEEYFTYPGSLTTPPLTENVTWTVFRHPLKISMNQLKTFNKFKAVPESEKDKIHKEDFFPRSDGIIPQPPTISNNYRPVQPLHSRVVRSSFKSK